MTVSPFPGNLTPSTFQQNAYYDIKIDTRDLITNPSEDITFRVSFGPPDGMGVQDVLLRVLPGARFGNTGVLAKGKSGQNLPVAGGGMFRAAIHDDPFFFDEGSTVTGGWNDLVADGMGNVPRSPATAKNFYGPNVNIQAITLEIPSSRSAPNGRLIGVWARTELKRAGVSAFPRQLIYWQLSHAADNCFLLFTLSYTCAAAVHQSFVQVIRSF